MIDKIAASILLSSIVINIWKLSVKYQQRTGTGWQEDDKLRIFSETKYSENWERLRMMKKLNSLVMTVLLIDIVQCLIKHPYYAEPPVSRPSPPQYMMKLYSRFAAHPEHDHNTVVKSITPCQSKNFRFYEHFCNFCLSTGNIWNSDLYLTF